MGASYLSGETERLVANGVRESMATATSRYAKASVSPPPQICSAAALHPMRLLGLHQAEADPQVAVREGLPKCSDLEVKDTSSLAEGRGDGEGYSELQNCDDTARRHSAFKELPVIM